MGLLVFLVVSVAISLSGTVNTDTNSTTRPFEKPVPEPGPDWPVAKQQWGIAWELHWVGLGIGFACLALNSLAGMFQFRFINSFARQNMFYAINGLLLTLGVTRSLYLWVDPYESGQNIARCPLWIVRPLFGIAFPCLMSAFCLLHVAFLEVAKVQLGSPKLRNLRFIVCIIALHFTIVLVSDTTVAFKANQTELLIVCQSFFIVWGLINSTAFLYSGSKVVKKAYRARKRICGIENGLNCGGKKPETSHSISAAKGKIETCSSKFKAICPTTEQ